MCENMGRRSDVRNVWCGHVVPMSKNSAVTLLDSLAEDLSVAQPCTNLGDVGRVGVEIPHGADDESCGVRWRTLAMKPLNEVYCPIHRPARQMTGFVTVRKTMSDSGQDDCN